MKRILFLICLMFSAWAAQSQIIVSGNLDINGRTTWTNNNIYILQGFVRVTSNDTLIIQPGTIIKGDYTSKGSLIVERDGFLIAQGTEMQPIVFTSQKPAGQRAYGDWGGVIVCGRGAVNQPANAANNTAQGEAIVEGGVGSVYGGGANPDDYDNSGVIQYVRIEFGGIPFQPNSEINGLTLCGVGAGTTIDHVQVSYCGDDAFEWFGGAVNAKNLVSYRNWDDDFDTDFGYRGRIQFGLVVRDPAIADQSGSNGLEADNDAQGTTNTPNSQPKFSNITVMGPYATNPASINSLYKRALHLRRNTQCSAFNSVFMGYPVGLMIESSSTQGNATNGLLRFKNNIIAQCNDTLLANTTTGLSVEANNINGAFNITNFFNAGNNSKINDVSSLMFKNASVNQPDLSLLAGSPLFGNTDYSDSYLSDPFFEQVNFRGAFGSDNWAACWTEFDPQNNPYNAAINNEFTAEITASGYTSFCAGQNVELLATASVDNVTFEWSNGAISTTQTVSENNMLSAIATQANGCHATTNQIEVVVFANPEVAIQALGNTSLCTGSSVELISTQSGGNLWNDGSTGDNMIVSETGTYSLTYTDANGCQAVSNEINVNVSDAPAPTISTSSSTSICDGETITINSSTADSYQWYLNGAVIENAVSNSIDVTAEGAYSVFVTNADACNGTGNSNNIFVTVNALPTADFSVIQNINSLNIQFLNNSVNATTYAWDFGDGNTSTVANPSHTYGTGGNYTVTLTASNGNCSASFSFDVLNVSTEELMNATTSVYPNPTQGIVNINVQEASQIQIMDLTGKVLMNEMRNAGNHQVNMDTFSNGLYIMSITSQNAQQLIKIQKN